jgi:hypothetical protein
MADNRRVQEFLAEGHPAEEIARLAGEGIHREGLRCLEAASEANEAMALYDDLVECDTIECLLLLCAAIYTRDTFLYRRVNHFLRSGTEADPETGRNLGLYIGLLREAFCVREPSSPLSWECPRVVYRGANFAIDVLVDYARHPDESIGWQGFTSSSRDRRVALGFPGNVLFEISLTHPAASLDDLSAFRSEQEFILSPYQLFSLKSVRWDAECGRWLLSLIEDDNVPEVASWIPKAD